jgi:Na+-transporting NADH:ubiquinone oxidoreductase subunit A
MRIELKRGLDIRLGGAPVQRVAGAFEPARIALLPPDYRDLHPALAAEVGDRVRAGQPLFHDRREPALCFTSFVSGTVVDIRRGARRRVLAVVVARDGDDAISFPQHSAAAVSRLPVDELRDILLRSGAWTALRARPGDRVASPAIEPRALFVTAIDTRPLAPDPSVVLADSIEPFVAGVKALARLASGKTYVCVAPNANVPVPECERIERVEIAGPHPAGLPGTHLHAVGLPVTRAADLWHIGYQEVAAIGRLLLTGKVSARRIVALSGPGAREPRLLRTIPGADLGRLADERADGNCRILSGSPLDGDGQAEYLGRYHNQVTLLPAASLPRGLAPLPARLAGLLRGILSASAAVNVRGTAGGMLPLEAFERVWPFRTPPLPMLRALLADDVESAEQLGCLGLVEEDLALCGYVCPGRNDYGSALRRALASIERAA